MEIAITKVSSKGQIVIPAEMREGLKEGENMLIIKNDKQFILKKASAMDEKLKDDLAFAKKTEEAYKQYEKGLFKRMTGEEFLKEIKKW